MSRLFLSEILRVKTAGQAPRWRGPDAGRGRRRHGAQDAEEAPVAGDAAGGGGSTVSEGHALPDNFDRGPV